MDFRHLIVTCLFSMLRLSFETQKIKENYAILKKEKELLPKRLDLFYRCQDFVSHYSMEVQTPYAHFLREKSLKTPYFLSSLE